jgi:serine/threonine protein kinase
VKTLKAVDANSLQRFRAEILLMKDLRHPNIVMLIGASWNTGRLMMVVELFERGNLADVLDSGIALTWRDKFNMLEDSKIACCYYCYYCHCCFASC